MEMEIVKPNSDLEAIAGTSRSPAPPSVCGISSDLQNLNLSESGVSGNPRNDRSPTPPKSESESDPMMDVEIKEMIDRAVAAFVKSKNEESRNGIEPPKYDLEHGFTPPDEYGFNDFDLFPVIPYAGPRRPLECPICGDDHNDYICPFVHDFPPGAQLLDHHRYAICCAVCSEKIVGERCPFHPNSGKRVGPNGYFPDDGWS